MDQVLRHHHQPQSQTPLIAYELWLLVAVKGAPDEERDNIIAITSGGTPSYQHVCVHALLPTVKGTAPPSQTSLIPAQDWACVSSMWWPVSTSTSPAEAMCTLCGALL